MLKEFKEFAVRGNVMDMAVGIIIGAAFGKIVTSFVNDILMPPIGRLIGKMDFNNMFINLSGGDYATLAEAKKAGAATINYGIFLNATIDFLVITFAVFLIVRQVNKMRREPPPALPTDKECGYCFSMIPIKAVRCPQCTSELGNT